MKLFNEDLSEAEIKAHKQWARSNYKVHSPIKGIWHPIVQEECAKMNKEYHLDFMDDTLTACEESIDNIKKYVDNINAKIDSNLKTKEPEIIGDDYPTYEDSVKQTLAEKEPTIEDQSEMEEHQHGCYEHMLDTFDWWQEYLAQQGPDGVLNIALEIIKYADKLKAANSNSCCGDSDCNG